MWILRQLEIIVLYSEFVSAKYLLARCDVISEKKVIDNSGTEKDFDLRFFFIRHMFTSTFKLAEKSEVNSSEVPL